MRADVINLSTRRLLRQLDEALACLRAPLTRPPELDRIRRRLEAPTVRDATALVACWERRTASAWVDVMAAAGTGQLLEALDAYEAAEAFLEAAERVRRRAVVARVSEEAARG